VSIIERARAAVLFFKPNAMHLLGAGRSIS
jgi:hypothetical protein